MVITRQVWMAAAVAGSAGCLALAPVRLALGKADAPVEITNFYAFCNYDAILLEGR